MPRKRKASVKGLLPDQTKVVAMVEAAIKENERLFVLWYGGVRAGKSTGAAVSMLLHSKQRKGKTYMVSAYTARQAMAIFMPIFKTYAEVLEMPYNETRGSSPHMVIGDNEFLIYGGNEAGRDRNITGITLAGLLLDDFPLLHPEFVYQAEARVSEKGALRIYTANKLTPYHWTTLHYYKRAEKGLIDAKLINSDTKDNNYIDEGFIAEKESEYDSVHYGRFINNEFMLDRPPLYAPLIDTGVGQPVLSAIYGDGGNLYVLNAVKTDYGYCVTEGYTAPYDTPVTDLSIGSTVMVNSERPLLARTLRRNGKSIRGYRSDFEPRRIEQTQDTMQAKLKFDPELTDLFQAMDEYHTGGIYNSGYIRSLEILGEHLSRKGVA